MLLNGPSTHTNLAIVAVVTVVVTVVVRVVVVVAEVVEEVPVVVVLEKEQSLNCPPTAKDDTAAFSTLTTSIHVDGPT